MDPGELFCFVVQYHWSFTAELLVVIGKPARASLRIVFRSTATVLQRYEIALVDNNGQ